MRKFKFKIQGNNYEVEIKSVTDNLAKLEVNGTIYEVEIEQEVKAIKTPTLVRKKVVVHKDEAEVVKSSVIKVTAPLPGTIIQVKVKQGDKVKKGDCLLTMEAMKMENNILSDREGIIKSINVSPGDNVLQGDLLTEIE